MTVEATKRYLIYSPPSVLTVHLKRFEQVPMNTWGNRMRTRKIRGHVEFPFVLNMAPFCSRIGQRVRQGQQEVIYSLYGIVSHSGGKLILIYNSCLKVIIKFYRFGWWSLCCIC